MIEREGREAELLRAGARADGEAFAAFYRLFERRVLGFFMRVTGRPELAADLTAETFACALESVENYDPARGRADQWLFGIARNLLMSSYREGRVEAAARERLGMPRLVIDDHASDTIARLTEGEDELAHALVGLPEQQRHAIQARVVNGREYAEIADELCCSQAVGRQRVSRGRSTLR